MSEQVHILIGLKVMTQIQKNGKKNEKNITQITSFCKMEKKTAREIFSFCFEPMKILTCSAPQNDPLNFSFVKDVHVVGEKMAQKGRKTAIYQSHILRNNLYTYSICKYCLETGTLKWLQHIISTPDFSTINSLSMNFSTMNFSTRELKSSWLQSSWLQSSWLQSSWLQNAWLQSSWLQSSWLQISWLKST